MLVWNAVPEQSWYGKKKKKLYDEQLEDRNDFALVTVICICFVTERIGGFVIMG